MSSARNRDSDNPVQLFPFVAVLLCTMGALLVLLVSVARSSRAKALEVAVSLQAQAHVAAEVRSAESQTRAAAAQRELEKISAYQRELDAVRKRAAEQLRQDRARMSQLEDHMRRLREELEKMKLAAAELNVLDSARFDDRKQAQAEVERLQRLIAETRTTIEELRAEANRRAKSYAIVPYQGKSGTRRRPIYIECFEKEAVLQPEGVVFTIDDFRPPIGPGNPLVASIRAAREHIATHESRDSQGKPSVPYPLIIVRPKGVRFYYYVREAIQSWDSEFGYELVEEDWELKYAAADPQLALVEYDAAELARARLKALADAAPQAYGAYRFAAGAEDSWGGDFSDGEDDGGGGEGSADIGGGYGQSASSGSIGHSGGAPSLAMRSGRGQVAAIIIKRDGGAPSPQSDRGQSGKSSQSSVDDVASSETLKDRYAEPTHPNQSSTKYPSQPSSGGERGGLGSQPPLPNATDREPDGSPASGSYTGGEDPEKQLDAMARAAAADESDESAQRSKQKIRGKNWAIRNADPGMIPIRRTIQISVRGDALAIAQESSATNTPSAAGHEFPFGDTPEAAYEDLAVAIDKRIQDWGMAGQGLYWRPVIELRVGPDGDQRVGDLVRLLQHGGAEVRGDSVATQNAGGTNGTTH